MWFLGFLFYLGLEDVNDIRVWGVWFGCGVSGFVGVFWVWVECGKWVSKFTFLECHTNQVGLNWKTTPHL